MSKTILRTSNVWFLVVAGWLVSFGSPAGADTIKFYNGGGGYGGTYSALAMYQETKNSATNCPDGSPVPPSCSGDVLQTSMTFLGLGASGLTATVNVAPGNKVWDDLSPDFGGLGVGLGTPSDSDQIISPDALTLTFDKKVTLTGILTLFADGHTPFGGFDTVAKVTAKQGDLVIAVSADNGATFVNVNLSQANDKNLSALDLTGTAFVFEQALLAGFSPGFYVSALAYTVCGGDTPCGGGSQTPLPAALPLFATGLGAMGLLGWRRKRNARAAL